MSTPISSEEAINTLLSAEEEARAALEACEREGEAIRAEGRRRARAIAARADERITQLCARCSEEAQRRVAEIEQAEPPTGGETSDQQALLIEAAERLAARLTQREESQ